MAYQPSLAWFLASWASKVAQCFIGDAGGATQLPQEVTIQCPNREAAGTQRDDGDQVLQAVKITDKKVPGLHLDLDEDFQTAACSTEIICGYKMGVVEPDVMRGLEPAGAFFLARARCLSAGLRCLRLTRLPRHDRGPVPGGNRSAASCLCTVLRRALYHYATRSPALSQQEPPE